MQILQRSLAGAFVAGLLACGGERHDAAAAGGAGAPRSARDGARSAEPSSAGPSPQAQAALAAPSDGAREEPQGAREQGESEQGPSEPLASGQAAAMDRAARDAGQARGPLPDLVLDAAYLIDSTRFDTQRIDDPCAVQQRCATGVGDRNVVRFGSRMGNIGQADFVLGAPEEANPLWTLDACSDRFSLSGFARYELRDADTGELVLLGSKSEFCMTDGEEWIPESGATCQTYSCLHQGIRPGCADNYGTDLPCQWLDVTDVPPGTYALRVTVNAERTVEELDYDNDTVQLQLRIDANGGGSILH